MACAAIAALAACNDRQLPAPPSSLRVTVTLTGFVRDTARRPVAGASVVLETQPGSPAVTDVTGAFTLSGTVPGGTPVALTATRDGYVTAYAWLAAPYAEVTLLPNVDLTLVPAEPLDLSGEHTLTVVAAGACGALPPVARRRTYDASITRHSNLTSFTIVLGGAVFERDPVNLLGRTAVNFVTFDFYAAFDEIDGTDLLEDLGGSSVTIWGRAVANATPADRVIDATFDGTISYCSETSDSGACTVPATACTSTSHQAILARK